MRRAALLALALSFAACSDDGGSGPVDASLVDAVPREVVMTSRLFDVGEVVEGIMTGGPNDHAVITLSAPTPDMDWNIHAHPNGGTTVIDEAFKQTSLDAYVFTPPEQEQWYLLIRNSGLTDLTIDIKIELFGEMTWEWQ